VDESLCYHARQFKISLDQVNISILPNLLLPLERVYSSTKVIWKGWPTDFEKFLRNSLDWDSSPGWPWRKHYPTNRDLFLFDGVKMDESRVCMVEFAVRQRWRELFDKPVADPIYLFIKQEPHKRSKVIKRSWRLISGVGLTDSIIDRILYGQWLDEMIHRWNEIPSKAGWAPQRGGYRWLAKAFKNREPVSIDKSAWDWTVNEWHVAILRGLIPRMIFGRTDEWETVFNNRISAMFDAGIPVFKTSCGCEFTQKVTGIMKSGMLGTIGFNSILQFAGHLAAGGQPDDIFFSLGDDTVQEGGCVNDEYLDRLRQTGALIKEIDRGFPIKFGGHEFDERECVPSYRAKHMFALHYLDERFAAETLSSYQHLYALDPQVSMYLEQQVLNMFGPTDVLSREYLRDWYVGYE